MGRGPDSKLFGRPLASWESPLYGGKKTSIDGCPQVKFVRPCPRSGKNVPRHRQEAIGWLSRQFIVKNFQIADLFYRATDVPPQELGYLGAKTQVP
jgi:hypothetical protein